MADDSIYLERAQSAEAALATCRDNQDRIKEKYRNLLATLGAKEKSDGTIDIDFVALVERLNLEHALELRMAIDEFHNIRGAPGEKPKVRVSA